MAPVEAHAESWLPVPIAAVCLDARGWGVVSSRSGYPCFPPARWPCRSPWRIPVKDVTAFRGESGSLRARSRPERLDVKKTLRTWRWLPGWFERLLALPNQFVWPTQVGLAGRPC